MTPFAQRLPDKCSHNRAPQLTRKQQTGGHTWDGERNKGPIQYLWRSAWMCFPDHRGSPGGHNSLAEMKRNKSTFGRHGDVTTCDPSQVPSPVLNKPIKSQIQSEKQEKGIHSMWPH